MAASANRPIRILILDTGHYHPQALAVQEYARQAGWITIFANKPSYDTPVAEARHQQADAVIVGGMRWELGHAEMWTPVPVPMVFLDSPMTGVANAASVLVDFRASGRIAAGHLIELGFRHLAYCWLGDLWQLNDQLDGFRQTVRAAGATLHELNWAASGPVYHARNMANFRRWLADQVTGLPKPLGLMVESDWTGREAEAAFRESGILVPDQVAIVSCFNEEAICEGALPPLSSVDMNWRTQGREAAALLDRMLHGAKTIKKPIWIHPSGVVMRASSDVMAVSHPSVARAMHLIRQDFRNPNLQVGDMARVTGISIVALSTAFRKHLGQTPGARLRQWRLKEAMTLLATTNRKAKDIASACGYGTVHQMIRCVRTATGLTPRAWRKQKQ